MLRSCLFDCSPRTQIIGFLIHHKSLWNFTRNFELPWGAVKKWNSKRPQITGGDQLYHLFDNYLNKFTASGGCVSGSQVHRERFSADDDRPQAVDVRRRRGCDYYYSTQTLCFKLRARASRASANLLVSAFRVEPHAALQEMVENGKLVVSTPTSARLATRSFNLHHMHGSDLNWPRCVWTRLKVRFCYCFVSLCSFLRWLGSHTHTQALLTVHRYSF